MPILRDKKSSTGRGFEPGYPALRVSVLPLGPQSCRLDFEKYTCKVTKLNSESYQNLQVVTVLQKHQHCINR